MNREQASAMTYGDGPVLVVAGAGTGKTTVITRRIAWLIQEKRASPEEILALTFTDKAAREMEERVDRLVPYGFVRTNIETFHALGDRILRDNALEIGLTSDFKVMTTFQQIIFLRQLIDHMNLEYYAPLGNPHKFIEAMLSHFSRLKDEYVSPKRYKQFAAGLVKSASEDEDQLNATRVAELARVYELYMQTSREQGRLDFGDQIYLTLELFEKRPNILKQYQELFKYILVDEFQDTNMAQNKLMSMLAERHKNLMAVGDDDQSIYRFRGAAIANILNFNLEYPDAKQIVLTKNYRSTQAILDASYKLIQYNNPNRLEVASKIIKRLTAANHKQGKYPEFTQHDNTLLEVGAVAEKVRQLIDQGVSPNQIAILIRKNKQAKAMMHALGKVGVASQQSKSEGLFERPEIKTIVNFISVINDPNDSQAFFGLLAGDIFNYHLANLADLASVVKRRNLSFEEYLNFKQDIDDNIITIIEQIKKYRSISSEFTAGELIYKFINDNGYLKRLVEQAEADNQAAFQVQNLAEFFEMVREFETIAIDPNIHSLWQYLDEIRSTNVDISTSDSPLDTNDVQVLTIHKAKGLEFDIVFMIDLVDQVFPSRRMAEKIKIPDGLIEIPVANDRHISEERRLFYVGLTRAKKELYLSAGYDHGGKRLRKISQFVIETMDDVNLVQPEKGSGLVSKIDSFAKGQVPDYDMTSQLYHQGWLHLTPHQIEDYLKDPKEFWFFHVLNMPRGPFHALAYGSAIHRAIEYYNRAKINHNPVSSANLVEVFENAWVSEGFVSRNHELARFEMGKKVISDYFIREEAKKDFPSLVEQDFSLDLPKLKVRISGRYDAVYIRGQKVEIRDFKTSQIATQKEADKRIKDNIQMAIYALAWEKTSGQAVSKISLHFVENDITATITKIDHTKILSKIEQVVSGIKNKNFRSSGQSQINFDRLL